MWALSLIPWWLWLAADVSNLNGPAGATIVFILCLGFYITPALLGGGRVILVSMRIATDIEMFFNWGAASAWKPYATRARNCAPHSTAPAVSSALPRWSR